MIVMAVSKKSITIDETPIYDTDLKYTRVIGLQQLRDINITQVLTSELSRVPPALFDESDDTRIQGKASLEAMLQVSLGLECVNATRSPDDINNI